jgi:GntR family transcriptional regulator
LYAQAEKVLEDLLVHGQYRIGDRIPPEVELVRSLGVSRATIRAAVGRLAGRGLLVRRQGSGTFLARSPNAAVSWGPAGIKLGSVAQHGRLETYTSIAEQLGVKADSRHLRVEPARATADEADALELPAGGAVTRVSRVLLLDGEVAAWMIDVLPADLILAANVGSCSHPARWCSTCSSTREYRSLQRGRDRHRAAGPRPGSRPVTGAQASLRPRSC